MNKAEKHEYVTKQDLEETKQELLSKLVTRDEFGREIKCLDGSIEALTNQVGENTVEIGTLSGNVKELRGNVAGLQGDVKELQRDVTGLHGDVKELRGEMKELRIEVTGIRIDGAELRGEVTDLRTEMHDKFNMVLTAIDGLSSQIVDMKTGNYAGEHIFKRHGKQLDDHETRIEKLERKAI